MFKMIGRFLLAVVANEYEHNARRRDYEEHQKDFERIHARAQARTDARMRDTQERCDRINHANGVHGY